MDADDGWEGVEEMTVKCVAGNQGSSLRSEWPHLDCDSSWIVTVVGLRQPSDCNSSYLAAAVHQPSDLVFQL
jgi:hypothetical protein